MNGKQIAVLGMGRSGIAVAEAAVERGARSVLFDERLVESQAQIEQVDALQAHGVEVVPGWHGRFEDPQFDLLVTSPGFRRSHPALRDAQAAGIPIWSEVEFAYQISKAPIVAVTGTNGKSTTVVMTWLLCRACADGVLCGNVSGSGYPELTLTEAAAQSTEGQVLVAEVSSFQLEWVHDFAPVAAAITNITPDHLDRHPNFADYRDTKLRLFANMEEGSTVVVNQDAAPLAEILEAIPAGVGIEFIGSREGASRYGPEGLHLSGLGEVPSMRLPWLGTLNSGNAAMAWELAMAALGEGANREQALAGLMKFQGLKNRMEPVGSLGGITIVNNSMCTNPGAVIANSQDLGQKQILLMGGLTKGVDYSPVREYLSGKKHEVVLFGPREEGGLHDQLNQNWPVRETLGQAFETAMDMASDGDCVMLSPGCASAAPYANFRERGDAFRSLVDEWLEAKTK